MLKGVVFESKETKFQDGKVMYKNLISVLLEDDNVIQRAYTTEKLKVGSAYKISLVGSTDLNSLKIKVGQEILSVDDTKKSIFNK